MLCTGEDTPRDALQLLVRLHAAGLMADMATRPHAHAGTLPDEVKRLSVILQGLVSPSAIAVSTTITARESQGHQLPSVTVQDLIADAPILVRTSAARGCQLLATWAKVKFEAYIQLHRISTINSQTPLSEDRLQPRVVGEPCMPSEELCFNIPGWIASVRLPPGHRLSSCTHFFTPY
jgi:hypothetical protein